MDVVHVTGGSGFTGQFAIRRLVARGAKVVALSRSARSDELIRRAGGQPVRGDLDEPGSVVDAFQTSAPNALLNIASLGFGHANTIVASAEEAGLKRAVFVSTTAIFTGLNAPSKRVRRAAEIVVSSSRLDWTIIRPTMIYGTPGDRNIARLLGLLERSPVIPVPGGGRRLQQPIHVEDLAAVLVDALFSERAVGGEYNVAGPNALTFRELIDDAGRALGVAPRVLPVPMSPAIGALRIYERLASRPRFKAEQLERLAEDKAFDIGPAQRDLGFAPRSFREGIAQEVNMLRATE